MGNFRPISEKTNGELIVEKMLSQTLADIRKYEDESIVLRERLSGLYHRKSDLDYLLETIIEDSVSDDPDLEGTDHGNR